MSETVRKNPKTLEGVVVSSGMDRTIVVQIQRRVRHPLYGKVLKQTSKLYAHDENNEAGVGDVVRVSGTRPLSKTKCWRLDNIVRKAG